MNTWERPGAEAAWSHFLFAMTYPIPPPRIAPTVRLIREIGARQEPPWCVPSIHAFRRRLRRWRARNPIPRSAR